MLPLTRQPHRLAQVRRADEDAVHPVHGADLAQVAHGGHRFGLHQQADLVVGHVEKYWCPTITSTVFTGKPFFRFKDDPRWVR